MKKNRDKVESPHGSAGQALKKGSAENILVFLALAILILAVGGFSSLRQFLQENIAPGPAAPAEKYVWVTNSPGNPEGLYVFTPEQLQNNFPEIDALLAGEAAQEVNSTVYAVQYDADAPQAVSLPPPVANIFLQPIPINRADLDILTSLPGIGPVLAEKIMQRRTQHGPFRSKDELLHIAGIGPKIYAGLVDHITLD